MSDDVAGINSPEDAIEALSDLLIFLDTVEEVAQSIKAWLVPVSQMFFTWDANDARGHLAYNSSFIADRLQKGGREAEVAARELLGQIKRLKGMTGSE